MRKYHIPSFLASVGVIYHATGTLDHKLANGKTVKVYDVFKTDVLTYDQKIIISNKIKDCKFMVAVSQYSPEIKKVLICVPKKAFYLYNLQGL